MSDLQKEANRCADELLERLARYSAEFRIEVFGTPPTLRVELSIGAAHHLLGLIDA
jgi:hypothetical protein